MSQLTSSPNITGIDHLPDELLSTIFENPDVPLEVLYELRLVSRRLHYFALPLYLARFKIKDPTGTSHVVIKDLPIGTLDALDGLQAALFVRSMDNVTFTFDFRNTPNDIHIVIRHMRRLRHFLDGLTSVTSVNLIFGDQMCGCCNGQEEGDELDNTLLDWSATVGATLNAILEASCQNLRVRGGRYLSHAFLFRWAKQEKPSAGRFTALKNLFRKKAVSQDDLQLPENWIDVLSGDTWSFERGKGTGTAVIVTPLSALAREKSKLHSLHIQSPMLSVPPLLQWTISAIQLPSLVSVKFSKLSINRKCWPALFSLIADANPGLLEIHFERIRQMQPSDLVSFLGRFQNLRTLSINWDVETIDTYDLVAFPDFPCLVDLLAPSCWVLKLLVARRMGLARLESITILYLLRDDGLSDWLRRAPGPAIPSLLKEKKRPVTVSLQVCLGKSPAWGMREDLRTPESMRKSDIGEITRLTLIFDEKLLKDNISLRTVLPEWITLFYDLRHLAINSRPGAIKPAELTKLVECLKEGGSLAALSTFEVNGEAVDLGSDRPRTADNS